MKKIFFNSSPSLRVIGHFNLITGLLIVIVFMFGQTTQAALSDWFVKSGWNSTNKTVESKGDVNFNVTPINTGSAIATTSGTSGGWNSENNPVAVPPTIPATIINNTSTNYNGWGSTNKEVSSPSTSGYVVPTTSKAFISTTTNVVPKEVPTIQISTVKNDKEENDQIGKDLKTGVISTTKIEEKKAVTPAPFSTPTTDLKYKIENTMNVVNSFGTTTSKIVEQAIEVKTEGVDLLYKDTNKDGVSDYDSIYVYNIDPIKTSPTAVYEGKKINAGEKILLGFDPATTSTVKISHEEPGVSSVKEISTYKINEVALNSDKQVTFKGKALPNSYVTLYIYSTPVIVTVKTDASGEWMYTLDKELEDGQHIIYTATVNNTGKILAKSTPFAFAKTAEAATLIPVVQQQVIDMKPEVWNSKYTIMIIGFLVLSVLAVLFVVGVGIRKNPNPVNEDKINDLRS
ncbi:MAG: Ig-like domain-containing protein [Candidatus Paceibacterota bacterium]|jgi:hypothetical protein